LFSKRWKFPTLSRASCPPLPIADGDNDCISNACWQPLPRGTVTFTDAEMVDLQSWFGARGKCPVVHIATGWIGA
jgi:hypothetical protein